MTNLSRALGWAKLGVPVFPCYEEDIWIGSRLHERKTPRTAHGLKEASTDIEVIEKYWEANPTHLVGVVPGNQINLLDIDMNPEKGKDGWHSLTANGVEVPDTFHVTTSSGGEHYLYLHPEGMNLGPLQNVALPNGVILEDVDRRAGSSYFIAWSDEVPNSLEDLSPSPQWLCGVRGEISENSYQGSVAQWLEGLRQGTIESRVQAAIDRIPSVEFNHQEMIKKQTELVKLGAEGFAGIQTAIDKLRDAWLRPPFNTDENIFDWNAALAGAVSKYGGAVATSESESTESELETLTQQFLLKERALAEAKRRLAAENFVGSEELTWANLENLQTSYLVQDLLPEDAICFLVAKRNVGKTFAYIDMVCSMATGKPWIGKDTRPAKTTIVIGEGRNGFIDRFKSWCVANEADLEAIKPWVSFIDRANLNSDSSIERIRKVAEREESELIIFDTWANTSGVPNEDDGALNSTTLNRAVTIKEGATLLFAHHPNKSTQDSVAPVMRGSGTLEGRADVVMTMFKDTKFSPIGIKKQNWFSLSTEMEHQGKNRNAATETINGLYLAPSADSLVMKRNFEESYSKNARLIIGKLEGDMTVAEFANAAKLTDSSARRALDAAVKEGLAIISVTAVGSKAGRYRVNEDKKFQNPDFVQSLKDAKFPERNHSRNTNDGRS